MFGNSNKIKKPQTVAATILILKVNKKEHNLFTKMITDQLTQHCAAAETKSKMAPRPSGFPPSLRQWKPVVEKHSVQNQHYHPSIYHFPSQEKNSPSPNFIQGSENPCPSPWLWYKMVSNSEIFWPCPHRYRLLSSWPLWKINPVLGWDYAFVTRMTSQKTFFLLHKKKQCPQRVKKQKDN